jgi:hypothetical protein
MKKYRKIRGKVIQNVPYIWLMKHPVHSLKEFWAEVWWRCQFNALRVTDRVSRDVSRDNALGMEELVKLLSNYHPKHNEYDAKIADRILGKYCVSISLAAS